MVLHTNYDFLDTDKIRFKIKFYCPIKIPARGRVITVIYITQKTNILIHKCNKQYTSNFKKLDWYISNMIIGVT